MGKMQDSMEGETTIGDGAIPVILVPILVRCSMSSQKLWETWGWIKVDVHNAPSRRLAIREYGCAKREGEEWGAARVARVEVEVCEEKAT